MAFKNNKLCQLLKIEMPVIQGGMVWCSGWRLAAAVSECGGLGTLGSGSMTPEILREHIAKLKKATAAPFAVNVPLMYRDAEGCMAVCLEEKVPVIITSAGSPSKWTEKAHAAGAKVGHVIANVKFALKAQDAGVDFIIAEGGEAGGHNGLDELSTIVLTQMVVREVDLPVISAGGYIDGRGLAAAIALGAEGIQIGSRFACTKESSAHDDFKSQILKVKELGTALTSRTFGPTRMIRNAYCEELLKLEQSGATKEQQLELIGKGRTRRGMFEGDLEQGELEIGQVSATFADAFEHRIPTVKEIFENIKSSYAEAIARLESK